MRMGFHALVSTVTRKCRLNSEPAHHPDVLPIVRQSGLLRVHLAKLPRHLQERLFADEAAHTGVCEGHGPRFSVRLN